MGLLTFVAVVVGWVIFRATSLHAALTMLAGMAGWNGMAWPAKTGPIRLVDGIRELGLIAALLAVVWLGPETFDLMRPWGIARDGPDRRVDRHWTALVWQPSWVWATVIAVLLTGCLLLSAHGSTFLYFQF